MVIMSRRIEANVSTQLNPFGPQWPTGKAGDVATVGAQVQQALFGRPKPVVLDPSQFPAMAESLRLLNKYRKKLAVMAGDAEDDYRVQLADGAIAMIDEQGTIYMGAGFLAAHREQPDVLVGALAHEIGHRPKRWDRYRSQRQLTRAELDAICREEETRADLFAGKALCEMGLRWEPLAEFLAAIETGPHPQYFPADVRAQVLEESFDGRAYRANGRRKIFPGFDRMTSPKGHLGEG